MIITALMWVLFIIFGTFAFACAFCSILAALGVFFNLRRDLEMCVLFAACVILMLMLGSGSLFAAIALGRNIL